MPVWIIVIIGLIFIFVIFGVIGNKESKKAGQQAADILSKIDLKYNEFIEKKIRSKILQEEDFNFNNDALTENVFTLLKPDIDALISHINSTNYSSARTEYKSKYFPNLPALTNEMFERSTEKADDTLSRKDEKEFYAAFHDGIKSDLILRINELKAGNF